MVYAGGSYSYGEQLSNKRGVVLSTRAWISYTGFNAATPTLRVTYSR